MSGRIGLEQRQLYLSWPKPRPSAPPPPRHSASGHSTWRSGDGAPCTARPIQRPGTAPHLVVGSLQMPAPPPRWPVSARLRPQATPPSSRSAAVTSGRPLRGGQILGRAERAVKPHSPRAMVEGKDFKLQLTTKFFIKQDLEIKENVLA